MEPNSAVEGARALPRSYRTPPLVEVVCEMTFSAAGPWDWTIPGLIYATLEQEFPVKREQRLLQMQLALQGATPTQPLVQDGIARMQFFSADQAGAVQVGPNSLVVNRLAPYPGWAVYRQTVLSQLEHYVQVAAPTGLDRVALRCLNRVVVHGTEIELRDYFVATPGLPPDLRAPMSSFFSSATLAYDAPAQELKIGFGSAPIKDPADSQFAMELEVSGQPGTLESGAFGEWLDAAHSRIELAFDRSFTERTHVEIFGEIDD